MNEIMAKDGKRSRGFILESIQDWDVYAVNIKGEWYPCKSDDTEIFIMGKGWKKFTQSQKNKMEKVGNVPKNWTAQDLKVVCDKYGVNVALGMVHGWGGGSLWGDGSYGLSSAKHEIANMAKFGKIYDTYSDYVWNLGNEFLQSLFCKSKGYSLQGNCLYYKKELIGFAGLYENINLHPINYIDHSLMGLVHCTPMFDPISFDKFLSNLISYQEGKNEKGHSLRNIRDKVVSVKDRITFLTNKTIAEKFEAIFILQETFLNKDEKELEKELV